MKPSFALSLTFDGIHLLHRAAGGWRVVGDVGLDAGDMAGELAILRRTASGLEPAGLRTKVLLPNEQIKYLSIDTPGQDDETRRASAAAALEGATPYSVADLAFDISIDGDKTHVAAVAHETLSEAESFAVDHRFHPVSFASIPGDQSFLGEPFFGVTACAATLLDKGETVEPDGIAVVVIGSIETPAGPVAAEALSAATENTPMAAVPSASPSIIDEEQRPGGDLAETTPMDAVPAATAPPTTEPELSKVQPAHSEPEMPQRRASTTSGSEAPELAAQEDASFAPVLGPARVVPQEPAPPAPVGFASRRTPDAAAHPQLDGVSRNARATSPSSGSVTTGRIDVTPDSTSTTPIVTPVTKTKTGFLSRRKPEKSAAASGQQVHVPASAQGEASEKDRMTVFGARKSNVGGKPRFLGLILTAALLVFLAGVAAWASVFLDDGLALSRIFGDRNPQTVVAKVEADGPTIVAPRAEIEPPEMEVPTVDVPLLDTEVRTASLEANLSAEDAAVLDALSEAAKPVPPVPATEKELSAKYAATGIWTRAPEIPPEPAGLVNIEDLYLTSIDPVSTATDAVALPVASSFDTDLIVATVSSPAAAGTQFTLDSEGLVIPTAKGALSPDGYTVFLGRPPLTPPVVPTRFQSEPEDTTLRSALAARRPQARPIDLVENTERAQLDGLTRSELAGYRPALRPRSLQQQAEAAATPEPLPEPIVTDGAVALALAPPNPIENATRLAVVASIRPDVRPRNFSRIVQRAQKIAPAEPVRVASAAAVAPRTVAPRVPSTASVAKQATVRNALNLRGVNLIGVYGKPSSRRALVRLGNGRYKKVVVGDRIDGGQVSAIGESELRYVKRGRNVVLKMPQ